ncbi:MAG: hypothetical protein O2820_24565 [Planctomycetota bacterium]|nr:hypothetical protein [Planctomycetota bacterium]MDA1252388.1 hypothetical protein [Planctomycetota bacterium]
MSLDDDYVQLADFLRERGHTETETVKIIERVQKYEEETKLDSIMDSIGSGHLDLASLIKEALKEPDEE